MAKGISPIVLIGGAVAAYFVFKPAAPQPGALTATGTGTVPLTPPTIPITQQPLPTGNIPVSAGGAGAVYQAPGSLQPAPPITQALPQVASMGAGNIPINNPVSIPIVAPNSPFTQQVTSNGITYPYLVPGAPPLPQAFDKAYYLSYILPAMVQANPNVRNAHYTLNATDLANYSRNYLDVTQWAHTGCPQGGGCHMNFNQALQYHWTTYGPGENRTFLPLPWDDMDAWVRGIGCGCAHYC